MESLENIFLYIIIICAAISVIVSIVDKNHPLGKKFFEGLDTIGTVFLPVAAILVSIPLLEGICADLFGILFERIGADPSLGVSAVIATDMGGYELAYALAKTKESWIMAMIVGYMGGATIVFSIPVALRIINEKDRKYLALGAVTGFIAIPIGVIVSCICIAFGQPLIRAAVSKDISAVCELSLSFGLIAKNLFPFILFSLVLLLLLKTRPAGLIRGFLVFGNIIDLALRIIFLSSVIESSTGLFSEIIGLTGFAAVTNAHSNLYRAAETACSIGIILAGAFPFVYILQTYLKKPLAKIGRTFNLSVRSIAGILAASANIIALIGIIREMTPEEKIICIAYSVCAAFLFGDHLLFTEMYQPSLSLPIMAGKFAGGCFSIFIASKITVPIAKSMAINEIVHNDHSV
ncbi:MAG: ethanolamine utilization protein EutH, partial [Clostridia bacterium]